MKILHTADLHLGQILYQNYERVDEHAHFFSQLERWCAVERPDALLLSGDVFDIQQPSATMWKFFTDSFVRLHAALPSMAIVITAGNHDSASRIQSNSSLWRLANARLIGLPPSADAPRESGWQEKFIVRIPGGYIIALPYMVGDRSSTIQSLLDFVREENLEDKPVALMAHTAVLGGDMTGHDFEIGSVRAQSLDNLGQGYDYLALGHFHKPQTLGHDEDWLSPSVSYHSPVARYSGSALHVSFDEAYPHSVSLVEIESHQVSVRQLRIDQLRHFHDLPQGEGCYVSAEAALTGIKRFAEEGGRGYIRLKISDKASLPSEFNQSVYTLMEPYGGELRYNPKIVWVGTRDENKPVQEKLKFEVADLQQMTDPVKFIELTLDQYPGLDMDEVREAFVQVEEEVKALAESLSKKSKK